MIENPEDETSVPEQGLGMQVVDAYRVAELNVFDSFEKRKVRTIETNKDITSWPVFDVYMPKQVSPASAGVVTRQLKTHLRPESPALQTT